MVVAQSVKQLSPVVLQILSKIFRLRTALVLNQQQYQLFPLPWFGLVGLILGQGEPVLGHKDCWDVSLVVNDYFIG